jgi:hypothetical protein
MLTLFSSIEMVPMLARSGEEVAQAHGFVCAHTCIYNAYIAILKMPLVYVAVVCVHCLHIV